MTTPTTTAPSSAATSFPAGLSPAQLLYPDLQQELASTRTMLERVPDDRLDFQPHDKSMTLERLANHLAELPWLVRLLLTTDDFDFAAQKREPTKIASSAERLAQFDALARELRESIEGADWSAVQKSWTLRQGERVVIKGQKSVLLRSFGLSHMAHHRAQLGVYLRLLGISVPGTYGPSADERPVSA